MNLKHVNSGVPASLTSRRRRKAVRAVAIASTVSTIHHRIAAGLAVAIGFALMAGQALAQATPSTAGIGSQTQNMSQELSTTGGFVGSTAMYVASLACFVGGVWALWQSRQEQNRTPGKVGMGLAGIALCGLFATGGVWINKASNTASGGNSTISSTSGAVTFGAQ